MGQKSQTTRGRNPDLKALRSQGERIETLKLLYPEEFAAKGEKGKKTALKDPDLFLFKSKHLVNNPVLRHKAAVILNRFILMWVAVNAIKALIRGK